jgi:hypothetical protein
MEIAACYDAMLQYLSKGDLPKWKVWTAFIMF